MSIPFRHCIGESEFQIFPTEVDNVFSKADIHCQNLREEGFLLASIRNREEFFEIRDLEAFQTNSTQYWLGIVASTTALQEENLTNAFTYLDGFSDTSFLQKNGVLPWRSNEPSAKAGDPGVKWRVDQNDNDDSLFAIEFKTSKIDAGVICRKEGTDFCREQLETTQPTSKPTTSSPTASPSISQVEGGPTGGPTTLSPTESPTSEVLNPLGPGGTETGGNDAFIGLIAIIGTLVAIGLFFLTNKFLTIFGQKSKPEEEERPSSMNKKEDFFMINPVSSASIATGSVNGSLAGRRRLSDVQSVFSLESHRTPMNSDATINHLKIRSVISKHTEYSQVSDMMAKVNNLVHLRGEETIKLFVHRVTTTIIQEYSENFEEDEDDQFYRQLVEFDSDEEPAVGLDLYLYRLVQGVNFWYEPAENNASVGMRSLLLALHYLRKLKDEVGFVPSRYNTHRILAILMLVSAKFIEDKPFSNKFWASVAGMDAQQISHLEDVFCFSLSFDFSISKDDLKTSLKPYEKFQL